MRQVGNLWGVWKVIFQYTYYTSFFGETRVSTNGPFLRGETMVCYCREFRAKLSRTELWLWGKYFYVEKIRENGKKYFWRPPLFSQEKSFSFLPRMTAPRKENVYIYLLHGIEGLGGRKRKEFSSTFLRSRNIRILYSPDIELGS